MRTYQNLIGGEWVPATSGKKYQNTNPADTREIVAEYASGAQEDAKRAIEAASKAFAQWKAATPVARGRVLSKASQILESRKAELAELLTREEGKTLAESTGEVQRAVDIVRFFGGISYVMGGQTIPHELPGNLLYTVRQPLGVVGMITPWNFPIAIPAWKVAPALLAGNSIVLKPASQAPSMSFELARALQEAGLPKGVLNVLTGDGRSTGGELASNPGVVAMSFTGSLSVGQQIYMQLAPRMARAQMEMGGKNPTIVLDDADLKIAVESVANSAFFSTGQRCTASSRVIVTEGIHDRFVAALTERINGLKVGDALEKGVDIGPVVDASQLKQDTDYIGIGKQEGAKLAAGGDLVTLANPGFFLRPTLFTEATNQMRISREEIFGPVASVIRVKDYDEALATANDTEFGLSAGIVTTSLKYATHFKRNSEAGMVMVNVPTAGVDFHVPFGGRKASSYGPKEQGKYAIEFFTQVKTAYTAAG
jgi:acyl-CoA reductase-like NAD-dependent aldehyde dehydrogenase